LTPISRRTFLSTAAAIGAAAGIPGCGKGGVGGGGGGGGGTGGPWRITLNYFVDLGSVNMTNVFLAIMSTTDRQGFEAQSGAVQVATKGFIYGIVRDTSGVPMAGVQLQALNDLGTVSGSIFYKTATGFNGVTGTNSSGQFIIFNVDAGRYNLRCISGASGNMTVRVEADGTTRLTLVASGSSPKIKLSGNTRSFINSAAPPTIATTDVGALGFASPFPQTSDGTAFYQTPSLTVDASSLLLLRLTKGVTEVATLNYIPTGTADLLKDLFIVTVAERASTDFTPGAVVLDPLKGIIRGKIAATSGTIDGYTIIPTREDGSLTGLVFYGDSALNGAPGTGLATDTSGVFYVYNADPGSILLRCEKGTTMRGSAIVEVAADSITMLFDGQVTGKSATNATISITGTTLDILSGAVEGVGISFKALTDTATSDGFGAYGVPNLPANASVIARCAK
jgi:hypothetical protein